MKLRTMTPGYQNLCNPQPIETIEQDDIGVGPWIEQIVQLSLQTENPLTIGLYGAWGVGKTSLLNLTEKRIGDLTNSKLEVLTVRFNAWRYEREDNLLIPMISTILTEIGDPDDRPLIKVSSALRGLLTGLSLKSKVEVPGVSQVTIGFDSKKAIERYDDLSTSWIKKQVEKSDYFKLFETIENASKAGKHGYRGKIVVFIDDLDRCLPDKAFQLMQQLKLVLDWSGFVFILALNPLPIEKYLEKLFRDKYELNYQDLDQTYLEKLIQIVFWIPPLSEQFPSYIFRQITRSDHRDIIHNASSDTIRMIGVACNYNPRQLGRLVNDYLAYLNLKGEKNCLHTVVTVANLLKERNKRDYLLLLRCSVLCKHLAICSSTASLIETIQKLVVGNDPWLANEIENIKQWPKTPNTFYDLLVSNPGREWLRKSSLREGIEGLFVIEQEQPEWINQQIIAEAIQHLESDQSQYLHAGIDKLRSQIEAVKSHRNRQKIVERLEQLMNHENRHIQRKARAVLNQLL